MARVAKRTREPWWLLVVIVIAGAMLGSVFADAVGQSAYLAPLGQRSFDAVIDTCGYVPRVVAASARLLAQRVERYVFVSSISVYADDPVVTESSPTQRASDPESEDVEREYGALKVLCERAVESALPGRAIVVRPGLIVGRYDYTGRFSYWPHRVARGG